MTLRIGMKISFLAIAWFACSLSQAKADESARSKPLGVGFVLGEPTGLSLEVAAGTDRTFNGGFAYSFDHWTQLWVDYAYHFPKFVSNTVHQASPIDSYIGLGAGFVFLNDRYHDGSAGVLVRVPFGLEYKATTAPIGFFLEAVPALLISSSTRGEFQGGIGVRFYF